MYIYTYDVVLRTPNGDVRYPSDMVMMSSGYYNKVFPRVPSIRNPIIGGEKYSLPPFVDFYYKYASFGYDLTELLGPESTRRDSTKEFKSFINKLRSRFQSSSSEHIKVFDETHIAWFSSKRGQSSKMEGKVFTEELAVDLESLPDVFMEFSRFVNHRPRRTFVIPVPFSHEVVRDFVNFHLLFTLGYIRDYYNIYKYGNTASNLYAEPHPPSFVRFDVLPFLSRLSTERIVEMTRLALFMECEWTAEQLLLVLRDRPREDVIDETIRTFLQKMDKNESLVYSVWIRWRKMSDLRSSLGEILFS